MFSCPYENYCGTLDLETIIPYYTGEKRFFSRTQDQGGLKYFGRNNACRYRIKFPMDSGSGDNIYFDIKSLKSTKLTIGLGTDFSKSSLQG